MQVLTPANAGRIVAMSGKAVARGADGKLRMVALGDWIAQDEVIVTAQNGFVQLAFDDAPRRTAQAVPDVAQAPPAGAAMSAAIAVPALPDRAEGSDGGLVGALRVDALSEALNNAVASLAASRAVVVNDAAPRFTALQPGIDRLAPLADAARLGVAEDTALPISLTGRGPDGTLASVWVLKVPTGGLLYKADGVPISDRTELTPAEAQQLVFRPAPHFHGNPGPLQFIVIDATGKPSAVTTIAIDVAEVNDSPVPGTLPLGPDLVAIADAGPNHVPGTLDYRYATTADTAVAGRVNATDVDLDPMRFATAVDPLHGRVVVAVDGSFVYTPAAAYAGADRFVVTVDDGRGGVATSTVFIDVAPEPAPAAQGVFAWVLGDAGASPARQDFSAAGSQTAAALDLHSVLAGPAPARPDRSSVLVTPDPSTHHLDMALDWSQRLTALDRFGDGSTLAHP